MNKQTNKQNIPVFPSIKLIVKVFFFFPGNSLMLHDFGSQLNDLMLHDLIFNRFPMNVWKSSEKLALPSSIF